MNLYSLFQQHPLICTDSRNCPEGSLFFALRGENFNANDFAKKAGFELDNIYVID
jgi:UDP-N-acetylmuramoyl-tripeptide--D-alanyl-D-alanine ligase